MNYPLVYRFIDQVRTDDWTVLVTINGRCLVTQDDDEWWCEAAAPGGFSGVGPIPQVAAGNMRAAMFGVLAELARRKPAIDAFMTEARALFAQVSDPAEAEWQAAREAIRAQNGEVAEPFNALEKFEGDVTVGIDLQVTAVSVKVRARKPVTPTLTVADAPAKKQASQFEEFRPAA